MSPRVLVIGGIGRNDRINEAICALSHVAGVVLIELTHEMKKAEGAFAGLIEASARASESIVAIEGSFAEYDFRRERDYPTMREGIRRKTIKSLNKGRR